MEGISTDAVLECTPPLVTLSPSSIAELEKAVPSSISKSWNAWNEAWNEYAAPEGAYSVDQYIISGDALDLLESSEHQMVVYNQVDEYHAAEEEPTEQEQQQHTVAPKQEHDSSIECAVLPVPSTGALPATSSFDGLYRFDVSCSSQTKSTKSVSFTYDENRRKLFANMNVVCPFHVYVNETPPPGTVVRVMAVYSQPNDAEKVVKRCLVHIAEAEREKKPGDKAPLDHLITCDHHSVQYCENQAGRHSIVVQYEKPEAQVLYTVYRLRFMCLSSCGTGMNRRPVKLIWTLEHNGSVLGRQGIDLKVCACPGRDRKNEEKMNAKQMDNLIGLISDGHPPANSSSHPSHVSTVTHSRPRPQKRGWVATTTLVSGGPAKTMKIEQQRPAEVEYTIKVPSKRIYTTLKLLRDALMSYKVREPQAFRSSQNNGENCSPPVPPLHAFAGMLDAAARPGGSTTSPTSATAQFAAMKVEESTDITSGPGALQCWLESIGLQCCFPLLVEKGIRDLNSLKQIPFKTLKRLRLKEHQETTLISAMRSLNYDDEDEELFPSQELPGAQSQGTLSQGSTTNLSQQSCTSSSSSKQYHVTRIRVIRPIQDHDYTS